MEQIVICRICLNDNVQYVLKNKHLQEIYEKLTTIPFQTALRPLALCYICFAQLKASHRFKLKCLKAEELLAQMLDRLPADEDEVPDPTLIDRSALNQLTISLVEQTIIDSTVQDVDCKIEVEYECDVKFEGSSTPDLAENSIKPEPNEQQSLSEPEDDIPLNNIRKTTEREEFGIRKKNPNGQKRATPIARKSKLKSDVNKVTPNKRDKIKEKIFSDNNICDTGSNEKCDLKLHVLKHIGDKPYVCEVCKKSFTSKNYLSIHKRRVHVATKPHTCDVCGKNFTIKGHLLRHLRIHTGERPFVCNICNKGFAQAYNLKKHLRIHNGQKPYVCDVCMKCFTEKGTLLRHSLIHTGEKPYVCNVCNKCFIQKIRLDIHSLKHTGEKPFICDVCGKRFAQKCALLRHSPIHTGEKPNVCNVCNSRFTDVSALVRHIRRHTGKKPFVCNFCGKGFADSSNLVRHTRTHTGEKPYVCDMCSKRFADRSTLSRHARVHTGERPYVCNVCEKGFTLKGELSKHALSIHGEKC